MTRVLWSVVNPCCEIQAKSIVTALLLAAVVGAVGCEPPRATSSNSAATAPPGAPAPPPPPGAESQSASSSDPQAALVATYRAAHDRKDVEAILKLYWLSGASEDVRAVTRENVEHELRHPIADIQIAPVPEGHPTVRTEGTATWRDSLPAVALLTVNYDTARKAPGEYAVSQAVFAVGMQGGRCYFTVPVREN